MLNALVGNFAASIDRSGLLFEHLFVNQVLHSAAAFDRAVRVSTFRTEHGAEVDFIIELEWGVSAVELEASRNVGLGDLRGLARFADWYGRPHRSVVLSQGSAQILRESVQRRRYARSAMTDQSPPVHDLASVSFAGATAVELAGNLTAPAPLRTPLGGNCLAFRTDVGFTVMERSKGDSNKRVAVFHLERTEMAAAVGLALDVDGTRIQLDPAQLQLETLPATSVACQTPPTGFESVMNSRHAARGRLTRRDQRLTAGDRVELAGSIEPAPGGGFRSTGAYVLHDLSTGALTQRDQRKRFVRGTIGIVALAVGLAGLMLVIVLSVR